MWCSVVSRGEVDCASAKIDSSAELPLLFLKRNVERGETDWGGGVKGSVGVAGESSVLSDGLLELKGVDLITRGAGARIRELDISSSFGWGGETAESI